MDLTLVLSAHRVDLLVSGTKHFSTTAVRVCDDGDGFTPGNPRGPAVDLDVDVEQATATVNPYTLAGPCLDVLVHDGSTHQHIKPRPMGVVEDRVRDLRVG